MQYTYKIIITIISTNLIMTVKLLRAPHRWGIPEIGMTSHTMQRHCMGGRQEILHQTAEDYGGANIPTAYENRDSR